MDDTNISKVIVRAWTDSAFRKRLIDNPRAALAEVGLPIPDTDPTEIVVVEDTPQRRYLVLPPALGRFNSGWTIAINNAERRIPQIAQEAAAIEATLYGRCQATIFLTPPQATGFSPHLDAADVLVMQCAGQKEWRLYNTPVAYPT